MNDEVPNLGNFKRIKPKYLPIIKNVKAFYKKELGHNLRNIYLRGSVSTGKDTNFSDMDFVAITNKRISKKNEKYLLTFSKKLQSKFSFVNGYDLTAISLKELLQSKEYFNLRLNLKTSSVLLFGRDVRSMLPEIIPGKRLSKEMFAYAEEEYRQAKKYFSSSLKKSYLGEARSEEFWCSWIMRVLCRSGMGILMLEKKEYTNDIIYISQRMIKEYPRFKKFFEQMSKWVVHPISDRRKIRSLLGGNAEPYFKYWKKLLVKKNYNE